LNKKLITFLASGFGSGLSPVAPGTAGTLVGVLICLPCLPMPWVLRLLFVVVLLALSIYVAGQAEKIYEKRMISASLSMRSSVCKSRCCLWR